MLSTETSKAMKDLLRRARMRFLEVNLQLLYRAGKQSCADILELAEFGIEIAGQNSDPPFVLA